MILEVVGGVASLVVTLGAGLFGLSLVELASKLFGDGDYEPEPEQALLRHERIRWAPLDLEPYAMPWPSERPQTPRSLPEMRWPSESWDDPHFGAGRRKRAHVPITSLTGNAPLNAENVPSAPQTPARKAAEVTSPPPSRKSVSRPTPDTPAAQPRPKPAPQPRPQASLQGGTPDADVLAKWVEQVGLAGAVGRLRDQTGMDFKTAARHLADAISKGGPS
jgi:hypothetical protein